jgi:hypothetical protein
MISEWGREVHQLREQASLERNRFVALLEQLQSSSTPQYLRFVELSERQRQSHHDVLEYFASQRSNLAIEVSSLISETVREVAASVSIDRQLPQLLEVLDARTRSASSVDVTTLATLTASSSELIQRALQTSQESQSDMLRRFLAAFFELLKQSNIPRPPRRPAGAADQQRVEDQRPVPVGSKRSHRGVFAEDVTPPVGDDCSRGSSPAAAGATEGEAPLKSARGEREPCAAPVRASSARASPERAE